MNDSLKPSSAFCSSNSTKDFKYLRHYSKLIELCSQ